MSLSRHLELSSKKYPPTEEEISGISISDSLIISKVLEILQFKSENFLFSALSQWKATSDLEVLNDLSEYFEELKLKGKTTEEKTIDFFDFEGHSFRIFGLYWIEKIRLFEENRPVWCIKLNPINSKTDSTWNNDVIFKYYSEPMRDEKLLELREKLTLFANFRFI